MRHSISPMRPVSGKEFCQKPKSSALIRDLSLLCFSPAVRDKECDDEGGPVGIEVRFG